MNSVFQFVLKNKQKIILAFRVFYFLYTLLLIYGIYSVVTINDQYVFFLTLAPNLGREAMIFFCLAITPGILRRFKVLPKLMSTMMLIRRQLGVTTFLFAFGHYMLIKGAPVIFGQIPFKIGLIFELFGVAALTCLTFLFFTSNDFSVKKLGKKWTLLHKLVYITVWFIFLHTILQRISLWSLFIGTYAVLETTSLIYNYFRMKSIKSPIATK